MEHTEVKYAGGKKFVAQNRKHAVTIDLPGSSGLGDQGPTPPELFIDSLASCIGVYVIGYCEKTGLATQGLIIKVDWEKELAEKPYYVKRINVEIYLPNADVGAREEALLKIAKSCFIHETIKKQPEINISLA
ncbi:OsmC family protein [Candidatus Omnitrophota bacterium]